jgi:hypothetical protein
VLPDALMRDAAYGRAMDEAERSHEDRVLSVRLDVYLDRQPISGRLRGQRGVEEQFVGWLGFVDALKRLHDLEGRRRLEPPTPIGEEPQ